MEPANEQPGRGGARPGAGRKPKLLTELLLSVEGAADDIAYAYALFRDTMRDERLVIDLRLDCAREVLNRLTGKPAVVRPSEAEDATEPQVIRVEYVDRRPDDPTP